MNNIYATYMPVLVSNASAMLLWQVHDLYLQVCAQGPAHIVQ